MPRAAIALLFFAIAASPMCRSGGPKAPASPRAIDILGKDGQVLTTVAVEIVSSPGATERGLMFRNEIPDGTGMLFVFPREEVRSFWMKNTRVSLDILFLDAEGSVVGIRRKTEPFSEDSISVGLPSKYVLEVAAGTCTARGIHHGARVVLPF